MTTTPPSDYAAGAVSLRGVNPRNGRTSWDLATITMLCLVGAVLCFRAVQEERWSGWIGDAQTLLTMRHWAADGILAHYALFVPQGYSIATQYLDEPSLRHHAHGIAPGSSPNVGPRLYYTHYPSGYLFPYALLMKAGWDGPAAFRILSVSFSLGAVCLMYLSFSRIMSPAVGFFAVAYYLTSSMFLRYVDSLANQPLDNFLRFLFIWLTLAESKAETSLLRNVYWWSAWAAYGWLALSSYDSIFFLLVWSVGFDLLTEKGLRLRRWTCLAVAPVLAFALQFLQNAWYLGLQDAARDILDTFMGGTVARPHRRLVVLWGEIASMAGRSVVLKIALGPIFLLLSWLVVRGGGERARVFLQYLLLFGVAGSIFAVVLVTAGGMFYQGHQFAPLVSLLVGGLTVWCLDVVLLRRWISLGIFRMAYLPRTLIVVLVFTVGLLWGGSVWASLSEWDIPPHLKSTDHMASINQEDLALARMLKEPVGCDRVVFNVQGFTGHLIPYIPGYPQLHPLYEYMADAPILSFDSPDAVAKDLLLLWKRSEFRFTPILVSRSNADIQAIVRVVLTELNSEQTLPPSRLLHGRYILTLLHPTACLT